MDFFKRLFGLHESNRQTHAERDRILQELERSPTPLEIFLGDLVALGAYERQGRIPPLRRAILLNLDLTADRMRIHRLYPPTKVYRNNALVFFFETSGVRYRAQTLVESVDSEQQILRLFLPRSVERSDKRSALRINLQRFNIGVQARNQSRLRRIINANSANHTHRLRLVDMSEKGGLRLHSRAPLPIDLHDQLELHFDLPGIVPDSPPIDIRALAEVVHVDDNAQSFGLQLTQRSDHVGEDREMGERMALYCYERHIADEPQQAPEDPPSAERRQAFVLGDDQNALYTGTAFRQHFMVRHILREDEILPCLRLSPEAPLIFDSTAALARTMPSWNQVVRTIRSERLRNPLIVIGLGELDSQTRSRLEAHRVLYLALSQLPAPGNFVQQVRDLLGGPTS